MRPKFSKNRVRRAGEILSEENYTEEQRHEEYDVITYWRTAHDAPMRSMSDVLDELAKKYPDAIVVCRLKRIDTIVGKLQRPGCTYKLNSMQDIAGCRIILPDLNSVAEVVDRLAKFPSQCKISDYIKYPKKSGYRGVHLIHRFDSPKYGYTNLTVETQVRTQLQHAWATAVETYDVLTEGKLKFGMGDAKVLRFFYLVADYFAALDQGLLSIDKADTFDGFHEIVDIEHQLGILRNLEAYSKSAYAFDEKFEVENYCFPRSTKIEKYYSLLKMDFENACIETVSYPDLAAEEASKIYTELEVKKEKGKDYLLVLSSSFDQLKKAYPNYYADISVFVENVRPFKS